MSELSLPRRFLKVTRNFGLAVAVKVTYSKIRGMVYPPLALPDGRVYDAPPRQVTFLIDAAQHDATAVTAMVDAVAAHGGGDWEICICERPPLPSEMVNLLARLRGTQPWLRIVRADAVVDAATAARWAVEQATGQLVAVVAAHFVIDSAAIQSLLHRLQQEPEIEAAALVGANSGPERPPSPDDCSFMMQRKSGYLACQPEQWPLTAPALARQLHEAKVRTAYVPAA